MAYEGKPISRLRRFCPVARWSFDIDWVLSAVKTEWTKYGDVLDKVQKKIHEASDTIEQTQTRTRVIGRKLKDVQELPAAEAESE